MKTLQESILRDIDVDIVEVNEEIVRKFNAKAQQGGVLTDVLKRRIKEGDIIYARGKFFVIKEYQSKKMGKLLGVSDGAGGPVTSFLQFRKTYNQYLILDQEFVGKLVKELR